MLLRFRPTTANPFDGLHACTIVYFVYPTHRIQSIVYNIHEYSDAENKKDGFHVVPYSFPETFSLQIVTQATVGGIK